jgi:branched-chain amino acid transport system substrate-binding protein
MSIKVGIPVSLTGQFSLQGSQTLAGLRAWADDVNRAGGLEVGGIQHPVQLIWRDDGSRRDNARVITQQLIVADRVDLLIGPYSAVLTNAAAEVAEVYAKLLWNQGGASPLVYQRGNPWVVGILTPADEYMAGLLPAVREVCFGVTAVAVVRAAKGAFPREVVSGVERTASALGFRVALSLQFDPETEDFSEVVQAVCRVEPDVLVVAGRFQNDLALATLLANAAPNIGTVAVVAAGVDAFRERLGDKAENFIGPSQWEPSGSHPHDYGPPAGEVVGYLTRDGQGALDYPMVQAFAAGLVAQRCLEQAGTLEDKALREAAAGLEFSTFYGNFKIDPESGRQTGRDVALVQWQQGRKVIVWPPEQADGPLLYPWHTAQLNSH